MKSKYGNTFNSKPQEKIVDVAVSALWPDAVRFAPLGAYVAVDATNTVGKKIDAGTPVELGKPGEAPKLGSAATNPTGLTYEDAYVGTDGCSLTVVVAGVFNESLSNASITAAQKGKLGGITFVKEV